jgi:hypothetical protein
MNIEEIREKLAPLYQDTLDTAQAEKDAQEAYTTLLSELTPEQVEIIENKQNTTAERIAAGKALKAAKAVEQDRIEMYFEKNPDATHEWVSYRKEKEIGYFDNQLIEWAIKKDLPFLLQVDEKAAKKFFGNNTTQDKDGNWKWDLIGRWVDVAWVETNYKPLITDKKLLKSDNAIF